MLAPSGPDESGRSRSTPDRFLQLTILLGLLLDLFGDPHSYYEAERRAHGHQLAALLCLALAAYWSFTFMRRTSEPPYGWAERALRFAERTDWTDAWLRVAPAVAAFLVTSAEAIPLMAMGFSPGELFALHYGAPLVLLVMGLLRAPSLYVALVALLVGFLVRAAVFLAAPITPSGGDMMPLIQGAWSQLKIGQSPYAMYAFPWRVPLTYLPVTWLFYGPAFHFGLDIRWSNIAAQLLLLGALLWASGSASFRKALPHVQLWAWFFLSVACARWDATAAAVVYWAALSWALVAVAKRSPAAPVLVAIAAASSPLVATLFPLIAIVWWRDLGTTRAVRRTLVVVAVLCALCLPWFLWSPHDFVEGTLLWFNDLAQYPQEWWHDHGARPILGLGSLFWSTGLQALLKPIQLAIVVAMTALTLRARDPMRHLFLFGAPYFVCFMLFNPVVWTYFYETAWCIALVAIATPSIHSSVTRSQSGDV